MIHTMKSWRIPVLNHMYTRQKLHEYTYKAVFVLKTAGNFEQKS